MKKLLKDKRFILLLISLSIILLSVAGFLYWKKSTYDPEKYNAYLKEAEKYQEDMQYSLALDKYLIAVEIAPREYAAYEGVINILSDKNRFEDAQSVIDQVELNLESSQLAKLYVITGNAKYAQGLYFESYSDLTKAYELGALEEVVPSLVDSALRSGVDDDLSIYLAILPEDSIPSESLSLYQELSAEETKLFDLVKGAKELLNNGYFTLARDLLEPRVDEMSEYWDGKYLLGRAYYEGGDYEKGASLFEDSVSLGADDPNLYWYLARTKDQLDKPAESYKYYDRAILFAADGSVEPIFTEYEEVLLADKQYSKAMDIAEMFSDTDFGKLALMDLYIAQDQTEKLDALIAEFIPADEYKEKYFKIQISYYDSNDQLDMISPLLEELKDHTEDQAYLVYCEGLTSQALEELTSAEERYKRAIDMDREGEVTILASARLTSLKSAE